MAALNDWRLTDAELEAVLPYIRALSNTATEKAVRGVALWLRNTAYWPDHRAVVGDWWNGWGDAIVSAADALDAMLAEEAKL